MIFWKYPRILRTRWDLNFANYLFMHRKAILSFPVLNIRKQLSPQKEGARTTFGLKNLDMFILGLMGPKYISDLFWNLDWAKTGMCWKGWVSSYWIKWVNIPWGRFKVRLVTRQWCSLPPPPPKLFWLHFWS